MDSFVHTGPLGPRDVPQVFVRRCCSAFTGASFRVRVPPACARLLPWLASMHLGQRVGLDVAKTEVVQVAGRGVLLVERFDRGPSGTRRAFVSALTILGLHELAGRHATYHDLAEIIRQRFVRRKHTLYELLGLIVFNILVGNTDDHARNHPAFWDGERLELTPAYDICPHTRTGGEQAQAMAIGRNGERAAAGDDVLAGSPSLRTDGARRANGYRQSASGDQRGVG